MAYTERLPEHQGLIWQDDQFDAVRVIPGAAGNLFYIDLQQRGHWINLSLDGATALIKVLQNAIKNQNTIIQSGKKK